MLPDDDSVEAMVDIILSLAGDPVGNLTFLKIVGRIPQAMARSSLT